MKARLLQLLQSRDSPPLLLVLATSAIIGGVYLFCFVAPIGKHLGPEAEWFTPSILWISGHGMVTPVPQATPGMQEFMRLETTRYDLSQIPDSPRTWDLSPFCQTHRYLLYAVGIVWKLFGVSWQTIKVVPLLAYIASAGLLYGIFRLACGRVLSLAGGLLVMLSPPVLAMLPSVRDFCKTPFFFAIFLLLGLLASRPLRPRAWLLASVGLGLACGIGLGFRQDFLACVLPAILGAALLPVRAPGVTLARRAACSALVLVVFLVSSWPVLMAVRRENGAVSSHTMAQGLSQDACATLGAGDASYEFLRTTNDNEAHATVVNYARRAGFTAPINNYLSPPYGDAGRLFFRAVALHFPYDLALRAFAAVDACFHILSRAPGEMAYSENFNNAFIKVVTKVYSLPSSALSAMALPIAIVFLVSLSLFRLRLAIVATLLLLYFTGYTSLLFQYRHAFHLLFIAPWFVLAVIGGYPAFRAAWRMREPGVVWRNAMGAAAFLLLMVLSLAALQALQARRLAPLIAQHREAALSPLETTPEVEGEETLVRLPHGAMPPVPESHPTFETPGAYLAIAWNEQGPPQQFRLVYNAQNFGNDFSTDIRLPNFMRDCAADAHFFFPVYEAATVQVAQERVTLADVDATAYVRARFAGIRLATADLSRLKGVYLVEHAQEFPFWLYLWVSPEDKCMPLHKHLGVQRRP